MMMGARIYLGRDFGMCVEFSTRCHEHFSGVGLGRDFGICQNLAADLGIDPDNGCSNLSWQRFWHVCRVLEHFSGVGLGMSIFQASGLAETLAFGET